MAFKIPVLLIAYRRPDTTKQVIDAIRVAAPERMFVACDGANLKNPGEAERVAATRALIEREIDWPCKIERRYSETNQGCKMGPSSAITWFFEQVDEGIILEDDTLPHPDFFPFCAELLNRYRDDERIWHISGNNFQDGQLRGDGSYYFSHIAHCWGWASWRRCWKHYDRDLKRWPALKASGLMETIFEDPVERSYWAGIWDDLLEKGQPDTWDYQWCFTVFSEGGLSVVPNRNLVSNVGFGPDGTHCIAGDPLSNMPVSKIYPLTHPTSILRDAAADAYDFDHVFGADVARRNAAARYHNSFFFKKKLRLQNLFNKLLYRLNRSLIHGGYKAGQKKD